MTASVDPNAHDRFILRQHIRPIVNQYEFSLPGADGQSGEPFCFVEQKRFKFKEDIRFYTDETKQEEQLRIKARQRFDPRARYDVTAADGTKIGEIQKVFGASLLRSTYAPFDAQGAELATPLRLQAWRHRPRHPCAAAFKFRDTYTIDMSGDPQRTLDRRLVLAIAVGMDALLAR